jgi:hypothetical protein
MRMAEKLGRLFDYAVSKPEGFTKDDVMEDLNWDRGTFSHASRALRIMLGSDDEVNLVCTPQGKGQPWLYQLTGQLGDDAKLWISNRLTDCESRVQTVRAITSSIVSATDGRSTDGRRARLMQRSMTRLTEDLAEITNGPALF